MGTAVLELPSIYIIGPITGHESSSRHTFSTAATLLRVNGFFPINPRAAGGVGLSRPFYMRRDLISLLHCDGVYMLPGWTKSKGSRAEHLVSQLADIPVLDPETLTQLSELP